MLSPRYYFQFLWWKTLTLFFTFSFILLQFTLFASKRFQWQPLKYNPEPTYSSTFHADTLVSPTVIIRTFYFLACYLCAPLTLKHYKFLCLCSKPCNDLTSLGLDSNGPMWSTHTAPLASFHKALQDSWLHFTIFSLASVQTPHQALALQLCKNLWTQQWISSLRQTNSSTFSFIFVALIIPKPTKLMWRLLSKFLLFCSLEIIFKTPTT